VIDDLNHADYSILDLQRNHQQGTGDKTGCLIIPGKPFGVVRDIIHDDWLVGAHRLAHHARAGRHARAQQFFGGNAFHHPEDQFIRLRVHHHQAARLAIQNLHRVVQNILQQGFQVQGGSKLAGDFVQGGQLAGTAFCFHQQAGLFNCACHLVCHRLEQVLLFIGKGECRVHAAQAECTDGLGAGIQRDRQPGKNWLGRQQHPAPLSFVVVIIRQNCLALADDLMLQCLPRQNDDVFLLCKALILVHTENLHQFCTGCIHQHQADIVRRNHLYHLGVGQLVDIVHIKGNVHTLGNPAEHVDFLHPALHGIDHLGALGCQCCLVAEGIQEANLPGGVGFTRTALPQGNPAQQALATLHGHKHQGIQEAHAGFLRLQNGRQGLQAIEHQGFLLVAKHPHQRTHG